MLKIKISSLFAKYNHIEQKMWFLVGMLITMPVLSIPIGSSNLALYNIPLFFALLYRILKSKNKVKLYSYKSPIYYFAICVTLSGFLSCFTVPSEWFVHSLRATIKLTIMIEMICLFNSEESLFKNKGAFFSGMVFSAPIQCIWIFVQLFSWRILGIKINTVIFGAKTMMEAYGGITLTGLSWERADSVLLFTLVTALSKKMWVKILCIVGVLMTGSRSGLLMIASVYFFYFAVFILKKQNIKKRQLSRMFSIAICIIIIGFAVYFIRPSIIEGLFSRLNYIINRLIGILNNVSDYGVKEIDAHKLYYIWLPNTLSNSSLLQIMFGSGTRVSGWMFSVLYGRGNAPWSVECDFISLILGNGILSCVFYYGMLFKAYRTSRVQAEKAIIFMIFIAGFLYQFYTSSLTILVILFILNKYAAKAMEVSSDHEN